MAIRNIVKDGDSILLKKCRPVEKFNEKLWILLEDMAESKFALVAEGGNVSATHPLVRSGYAVLEAMAAHANSTHSYMDRSYFNDALTLLDDTRDAEELAKLKKMLNKF